MNMASNDLRRLREELLAKEQELSGMHQLLVEQDDDLRACQHRLGDLESTLIVAFTGDDALFAQGPTSSPLHPVRRALYDDATASGEEDVDEGIESTTALASVRDGESTLPAKENQDQRSASVSRSIVPDTAPSTMLSNLHGGSTQGRAAAESPRRRVGTLSDASESSQSERDTKVEWARHVTESTALSTTVGVADTAGTSSTERPRDVVAASTLRPTPVTPPSVFPARPAAVAALSASCGGPTAALAASPRAHSLDSSSSHGEGSPKQPRCQNEAQSTPPERHGTRRGESSRGGKEGLAPGLDSYGRCLDRSLQARQDQGEGLGRDEGDDFSDTVSARSDVGQSAREQDFERIGEDDDVDRLARAEWRAETAEAAERVTAARMLSVAREATVAKEEADRLGAEVLELSRWREAVLDLRDVLNVAQKRDRGTGNEPDRETEITDSDPVARHAKWVSSPALETLLPQLHRSARELLSDLAAAREQTNTPSKPAVVRDLTKPAVVTTGVQRCGRYTRAAESGEREGAEESYCSDGRSEIRESKLQGDRERKEEHRCVTWTDLGDDRSTKSNGTEVGSPAVSPATGATISRTTGRAVDGDQLVTLRKSCETLRIMVDALREKDEESQKRIFALEQQVFDASLAALRQEALVSTLRRQLESRDSTARSACESKADGTVLPQRGNQLAPRRDQSGQLSRFRNEFSLSAAQASPPLMSTPTKSPRTNQAHRTENPSGTVCYQCGGSSPVAATPTYGSSSPSRHFKEDKPRTPTTDILRRLLYENTPTSAPASEPDGGKSEVDGDGSDGVRERSRHGRRLFAEGSTVLRACPTAGCDVAGVRRGPGALFSDSACGSGVGRCEAGSSNRLVAEDDQCAEDDEMPRAGRRLKPTRDEATGIGRPGEREVPLPSEEVILRERLLRARRDFSALHM